VTLCRRGRGVEMLRAEQSALLSLHEGLGVELEWSKRVLCKKKLNAADNYWWRCWQRVRAVHS